MTVWELLISPVKTNHTTASGWFCPHFPLVPNFLKQVPWVLGLSLKVTVLRTLSKNQTGSFYDMWVWKETSYSYSFRLQLLCPPNSETADARKSELALFYRAQWWGRRQKEINSMLLELGAVQVEGQIWGWNTAVQPHWNASPRAGLILAFCTYSWRSLFPLQC